jgi:hypothetical protein
VEICPIKKPQEPIWDYNNMPSEMTEQELVIMLAERKIVIDQFDNFTDVLIGLKDFRHLHERKGTCYTICHENGALIYRKGMHYDNRLGWAIITRIAKPS